MLAGITVEDNDEKEWKKKKDQDQVKAAEQNLLVDKFAEQRTKDKFSLYREKEVQNLADMIYS